MDEGVFLCVSVHFQCVCVISLCGNTEGEEWGLTLMKLDGGRSTSNKQSAFSRYHQNQLCVVIELSF